MIYTKVPKPTGPTYTTTNPLGKLQYNESTVLYSDPNIYYNGNNPMLYTKVAKPVLPSYTKVPKPV